MVFMRIVPLKLMEEVLTFKKVMRVLKLKKLQSIKEVYPLYRVMMESMLPMEAAQDFQWAAA